MKRFFLVLVMLLGSLNVTAAVHDINKSKQTDQDTIESLFPALAQPDVHPDTYIEIVFNVPLDEKQIKPNALRLRRIEGETAEVDGIVSYLSGEKRLRFVPSSFLKPGVYELDVMDIKTTREYKRYKIKDITYRFCVADVHPLSLKITPSPIAVKEGSAVDLTAAVVYDDGSEQTVIDGVVWSSGDDSLFSVAPDGTGTAVRGGQTTVKASYKAIASTGDVEVYIMLNGYRLPPEPDPALNNSTLLGIDSNNNGVRDDVERWIIRKYRDEHRIVTEIALQAGRAAQIVIKEPARARETMKYMDAAMDCQSYFKYTHKPKIIHQSILDKMYKKILFNTKERIAAFSAYNEALSGRIYGTPTVEERRANCDFDVDALLQE